jgi:YfiH family protein
MIKNKSGIFQFSSFLEFPNIIHGFSSRSFGSFKSGDLSQSVSQFANACGIKADDVICMEQVHGARVVQVVHFNGTIIPEADGMVGKEKSQFLCVRTADCVPVIAIDPITAIHGVAHAGWRGALGNIAGELVDLIIRLGGRKERIRVGLGPSIHDCCYAIDEKRVALFTAAYPQSTDTILTMREGKYYLNLQQLVAEQLVSQGVKKEHIEDSSICTYDHSDTFFSFRDKKSQPGLFAGIIGVV